MAPRPGMMAPPPPFLPRAAPLHPQRPFLPPPRLVFPPQPSPPPRPAAHRPFPAPAPPVPSFSRTVPPPPPPPARGLVDAPPLMRPSEAPSNDSDRRNPSGWMPASAPPQQLVSCAKRAKGEAEPSEAAVTQLEAELSRVKEELDGARREAVSLQVALRQEQRLREEAGKTLVFAGRASHRKHMRLLAYETHPNPRSSTPLQQTTPRSPLLSTCCTPHHATPQHSA